MIPEHFKHFTTHEKLRWLEANADHIKEEKVRVPLTQDEIEGLNAKYVELSLDLRKEENELKEIKDQFKERMNPLKAEIKQTLEMVADKFEEVDQEVFYIADHEAGRMFQYTADGTEIGSRKLFPNERQASLGGELRRVSHE